MNDDLWLKELAQVNREREAEEQSRLDERWDRLSAGGLSPQDEAELKALAGTSEEAREAYEAFRPLGADFQASVVQAIQKQGLPQQPEAAAGEPPAKLLPFRRRNALRVAWSVMATVAAAALFFIVRSPAPYPPLPIYTAELSRGDQQLRGETEPGTNVPVFSPGSTLTLDAAPEQSVTGPVEAAAFAGRGAELIPLDLRPQVGKGAVRLRGRVGQEIRLQPGDWRIWIVVGRPGKVPALNDLRAELQAGRRNGQDWYAVSGDVRIGSRPPA